MEPPKKQIFGPYWNGAEFVYGDPLEIRRKLKAALAPHEKATLEDYRSPAPEFSVPAAEKFNAAVVHAFGLLPFDKYSGAGMDEAGIIATWNSFQIWLKKKDANTETMPTSAQCLGSEGGKPSTAPSPTQSMSASHSIPAESG